MDSALPSAASAATPTVSLSSSSSVVVKPQGSIRREDYAPPDWFVLDVALDFRLGIKETRVSAILTVRRNPDSDSSRILLNGDGLVPYLVVVDGVTRNDWWQENGDLLIDLDDDEHEITIETHIQPMANSQLMGLYASNGMLCTQCEAEGFRRIIFFPDRPDVLAVWRVRMEGSKTDFPVLLSNGDCVKSGEAGDGSHWAEWHDPWPKPSYLFALVAGDLVARSGSFTTAEGRDVVLNIWVRPGDEGRTHHALASLQASMRWDEECFARCYDLDLFNIVAVSDFNMGAMENKGLNIFNTRYVLADPETATDADYDAIEAVIGHEYFHNWSGNRVTCRDWFQLSLKEGFTVLRDQLFSADMGSAAVKRIEDVRVLRGAQFSEDSGPLAHPIRPDSYQEISNFYTSTVYNKGAEVIRMMRTLAGPENFRKGCDLYFARHDGEAATCEDFVCAIEEGAGLDLALFRRWYSQAGTPRLRVRMRYAEGSVTLDLAQDVPATPGQSDKLPMPIPLRLALFDTKTGAHAMAMGERETLIVLDTSEAQFIFSGFSARPVLSINRGFSAPVLIDLDTSTEDLVFLAGHDDDPFARYEAMQDLMIRHLVAGADGTLDTMMRATGASAIIEALRAVLADQTLDDLMRGELIILPGHAWLSEQFSLADPGRIHAERERLKTTLGNALADDLLALYRRVDGVPYSLDSLAKGARKVKTQALVLLAAARPEEAADLAAKQYDAADNMTDRQSALMVLAGLETPARQPRLDDFYARYKGNALVIDKWFALQAGSLHPCVLDQISALVDHEDFTLANPNRVRSLYMALAGNPVAFHDVSGLGYRMIGDLILALDPLNAQTAARFVTPLGRWRRVEPLRAAMIKAQLERIAAAPNLSRDTREQVDKSLG